MSVVSGRRAGALLAVLLGCLFGMHRIVDPDLFQQVAVGRWILAHPGQVGRSPFHDLYPDHAYVEDKPLSSVLAALAERTAGEAGLALYQLLLPALVAAAWYALLRSAGSDPWTSLAAVALALAACAYRLEPRPDTWSHGLFATAAILVLGVSWARLLWSLPLLFALWVNLHGYWVAGFLILAAAAIAAALGSAPGPIGRGRSASLRLCGLAGLCLLACGAHPQGWRAIVWPLEQLRLLRGNPVLRAGIVEFFPTSILFEGGRAVHVLAAAAFPLIGLAGALRRRPWTAGRRTIVGLLGGAAWLLLPPPGLMPWPYRLTSALALVCAFEVPFAVRERRFFPVLAWIGSLALALPLIRNLTLLPPLALWILAPVWTSALRAAARPHLAPGIALALVGAVAWARVADRLPPGTTRAPGWTGLGIARDIVPLGAAEHLGLRAPRGKILNDFQSGGVLLWRLPGRSVFIAGNTSLYPPEHLALYREQILSGRIGVDLLPARFGVDTIVLEHAAAETPRLLSELSRSRSWKLTYLDEAAAVLQWSPTGDVAGIDLERAAVLAMGRLSSRSPLPRVLDPARRLFPPLNLGIFLRAYGRPDLALHLADRLWREGPALAIATFRVAAAEEAGALAEAVPFLEEAVRALGESDDLRSRLARALFFRAAAALARGDLEGASPDLERATRLRPLEPGPWVALARLAALEGDTGLARDRLARARSLPGGEALREAAMADPVLRGLW